MKFNTIVSLASILSAIEAASVVYSIYPQQTAQPTQNVVFVTRTRDASSSSVTGQTTAITSCHYHGKTQFCVNGQGEEGVVVGAPTKTQDAPTEYTGCHAHSPQETFCIDPSGEEVQFQAEGEASESSGSSSGGKNCHFHAGVEHCVGGDAEEASCERVDRDYNIPLRIGLLFVILVTSGIGAFGPIFVRKLFNLSTDGIIFVIIKQFGTGVIISTAFVHLITHASLMWGNECLGELEYESTGTAITMAGIFIAFLIEYFGHRALQWRNNKALGTVKPVEDGSAEDDSITNKEAAQVQNNQVHGHHEHSLLMPKDKVSVTMMEVGIVFHSIIIGITLVVAGDSSFITLFIVILFHQMFEGLALGSRIAELEKTSMLNKLIMAFIFTIITPIGMAIGIGVLSKFNGNDKSTLIALGTLDSFSAGVLIWTGLIEMWSHDWLFGKLAHANAVKTAAAMFSLILGMLLMSLLGKWA
ncbi:Zinc transporter 7 [Wickerhamomyces ciferrii]|uniref:Zinc transporter 7 n=1 Tax=Wickerhamomyces ciferrii (strain ATCC 14091 / BCRC 22168 / CBS 111 / JCM 3599 / NBRC 0793 / NRRL Y-1031 F-60-10) TaxID=1206466 RepID=K0K8E9_WICCF|nr:Zinc transporter 7 [Wickerhamomyces ciferrii]CCH41120.1 Zinc transporter 7 [Wickerhamomyces ciferrii]